MLDVFLAAETFPFAVALVIMLLIALIEGVGLLVGFAFSSLLDNLLPEADLDIDAPDLQDHGSFGEFLSWLRVREVPVIVVLIAFLTSYAITGFMVQHLLSAFLGFMLPTIVAGIGVLFLSMPGVRLFAGALAKIMPRDETEAISSDSFIGRIATITAGVASAGNPAQARFKDRFGQRHYVLVAPDKPDVTFQKGDKILLVRQEGACFYGIFPDEA